MKDRSIGVRLQPGAENFLFVTVFRPALEFSQPPIQWVSGTLFPGELELSSQGG
jgi:hypothetical protein